MIVFPSSSNRAYPALAAKAVQRLWKYIVVEQAEKIPLRTRFCLEVPEHPAFSLLLEYADLGRNVQLRVRFHLLTPRLDKIDVVARTNFGTVGIPSVISCTDLPTVKSGGAISHCPRPFGYNGPFILTSSVSW